MTSQIYIRYGGYYLPVIILYYQFSNALLTFYNISYLWYDLLALSVGLLAGILISFIPGKQPHVCSFKWCWGIWGVPNVSDLGPVSLSVSLSFPRKFPWGNVRKYTRNSDLELIFMLWFGLLGFNASATARVISRR